MRSGWECAACNRVFSPATSMEQTKKGIYPKGDKGVKDEQSFLYVTPLKCNKKCTYTQKIQSQQREAFSETGCFAPRNRRKGKRKDRLDSHSLKCVSMPVVVTVSDM